MVNDKMKQNNKVADYLYMLCVMLFFLVTVFLLAPLEIVVGNSKDLCFGVEDFFLVNLFISLVVCLIGMLMAKILAPFLLDCIVVFVFVLSMGFYIQANFLNGAMKSLQGQMDSFSLKTIISNILIWIFIIAIVLVPIKLINYIYVRKAISLVAIFLFLVQIVAVIVVLLSNKTNIKDNDVYLTSEHMLELSGQNDVIVFILDTVDGKVMDRLLEENPDFLKPLDGFTYYPNCTSVHSRTYPSVPYILTGEKCFFDKTPEEYVDVAYEESEFWNTLTRYNVNIGLYTRGDFIGEKAKNSIVNYYNGKPHFDKIKIFLQTIKMTMYRDMPYCFKRYFHYEASDIASAVIENDEQPEAFQYFNDEWLSNCISSNGLSIETGEQNKTFRFIHFGAYHLGWTLDSCKNAFYAVYDYIDQMKKNGIYDEATIIITADHGFSGGGDITILPQDTAVPLMIVKTLGDSGIPIKVSNAPVSHTEIIPTVLEAYGLNNDSQPTFSDIELDSRNRDRLYYHTALYSDEEGEVVLKEYKVIGDARYPESYVFTGNTWDVNYSLNKIDEVHSWDNPKSDNE